MVSGTSSHNLHSIFITHTHNCHKFNCKPFPPPVVSSHTGRRKMAARGGGQRAKTRPPIRRQMHASSHGGGVRARPTPSGSKEGQDWLVLWRGMRSRPAGLLAIGQSTKRTTPLKHTRRKNAPQNTHSSGLEPQGHGSLQRCCGCS